MIQTYTAQLDRECISVWKQTAISPTITQWLFMCFVVCALLGRLQYFGQGLNPAYACYLTFLLKKYFSFSSKNFDQEGPGDQKHNINFAWPNNNKVPLGVYIRLQPLGNWCVHPNPELVNYVTTKVGEHGKELSFVRTIQRKQAIIESRLMTEEITSQVGE